jgi:predicted Zn-dependent protease
MGKITLHPILNIKKLLAALVLTISTGLLIILANFQSYATSLPSPKPHSLPSTLAQWADKTNSGDYFSQVETTEVGYLIWSRFPVRVYIEQPKAVSNQQAEAWVKSVLQAVQEWSVYLPLKIVEKPDIADIKIVRKAPPLQLSSDKKIPRARSALTSYQLYTNKNVLLHRFT